MMQTDGHLFHIDFGHFWVTKTERLLALDFRENAALVFTPQMLHVLDQQNNYDKANASM